MAGVTRSYTSALSWNAAPVFMPVEGTPPFCTVLSLRVSAAVFGWILTLLVFYAANYYFDDPWMQKQLASGSTWITFFTARLCDAFALIFLGASTFFLEVYHSEGAGEAWGWLCALCFKLTAIAGNLSACLSWSARIGAFSVTAAVLIVLVQGSFTA